MAQKQASTKGKFSYPLSGWKYSSIVRWLLFLLMALLFYFSLYGELVPKTFDIKEGMVLDRPILAPKQIENTVETLKAKDAAAKQVQPVYTIVALRGDTLVNDLFNRVEMVNGDSELKESSRVEIFRTDFPRMYADFTASFMRGAQATGQYPEELLKEIQARLEEQKYRIPEEVYYKFPLLSPEELAAMRPVAIDIVKRLSADPLVDAQTARTRVAELVNASPLARNTTRELVQEIVRFAMTPNKFYDDKATTEARTKARDLTPIVYTKKNDVLVPEGQVITTEIYQKLDDLELLKGKTSYLPQLGVALLSFLFVIGMYMFIRQSRLSIRNNNAQLVMLLLIFITNVMAMKIVSLGLSLDYFGIGYLAPAAMGIMLVTILLDARLAFMTALVFSVMTGVIFNTNSETLFDFGYFFVSGISCITAIFAVNHASQRSSVLRAGIIVSLLAMSAAGCLFLLEYTMDKFDLKQLMLSLSFAFGGGLLTSVLVIGFMPVFEAMFGILSPLKLVELSNPNHPLLRKLLTETPGTYHHSVMVGNLAESAAESIGANGLLCRVGAYYHDVGKTKRPSYFIENQSHMDNPHDSIEPALSKSIIVAHARDGVEMLKEHKIPKPLCDIAEQHHGTTLLKYFYHKAIKQQGENPDKPILESDYRYPGPKAQTKETAIVGVADCVEAAVRSLRNPTVEQIDSMLRKIIKDRLDDGQFDECDLTLKELDQIAKTMKETLLGIFHSRIEYPADLPKPQTAGDASAKGDIKA
jgi:cyclic-di-AMP phosphodiesterase PgpH